VWLCSEITKKLILGNYYLQILIVIRLIKKFKNYYIFYYDLIYHLRNLKCDL
jgi:hypothetical protein